LHAAIYERTSIVTFRIIIVQIRLGIRYSGYGLQSMPSIAYRCL
jgi:hypothetical protein